MLCDGRAERGRQAPAVQVLTGAVEVSDSQSASADEQRCVGPNGVDCLARRSPP